MTVKSTVEQVLQTTLADLRKIEVSVGVSGRHVHLSQEHVEKLFGPGYQLTPIKLLTQPGQFACQETLTLKTEKGSIEGVRVLGPARAETQVELALTDTFRLKLENVPVRMSGRIAGTPGVVLVGPAGEVKLNEGVIISQRHVHMRPEEAEECEITDGAIVSVLCGGFRQVIFGNVIVRVHKDFQLDFHIDTDEANAAGVRTGDKAWILLNFDMPINR